MFSFLYAIYGYTSVSLALGGGNVLYFCLTETAFLRMSQLGSVTVFLTRHGYWPMCSLQFFFVPQLAVPPGRSGTHLAHGSGLLLPELLCDMPQAGRILPKLTRSSNSCCSSILRASRAICKPYHGSISALCADFVLIFSQILLRHFLS